MYFNPVVIKNVFNDKDIKKLRKLLTSGRPLKNWKDVKNNRRVLRYKKLDSYFSKKLEPLAREIFKDQTLKSTYAVYLDYNESKSKLPMHRDNNACTYTIDYCVSQKTPWGIVIEGEEFFIKENEGLAFMGGYDLHGRKKMPDSRNNRVEVIMFHFCPEDHWWFTEGQDYLYFLKENDLLPEGDSYYLSPEVIKKNSVI